MQIVFLLPLIFSIYFVVKGRLDRCFLDVYLPCTFFVPYYYNLRFPHLPQLSLGTYVLIPMAISLLVHPNKKWRFRRMDLLVLIFMISFALSELLREYNPKDGFQWWLQGFFEMFFAYIVGRQVIEPNLRLATIKRIVFLFVLQAPFALWEWKQGVNVWLNILGYQVFRLHDVYWFVQLRNGKARIATCFSDAILAGMMFMVAMALNYYLVQIYKTDQTRLGPRMSWLQKYRIPFFLLPLLLYLTISRMPLACGAFCFLILQIPRFKDIRVGATVILLSLTIAGGGAYYYFQKYTNISDDAVTNEEQSSALYRKDLVELYAPVLEEGGWLGYGALSHPSVQGLNSIDNNYMLVQLSQGKLGKYTFQLIAFESVLTLVIFAARFRSRESLFLVFTLMGALIGLYVSLTTVYLGEQVSQVLFLLIGWSQSLDDTGVITRSRNKFEFKRVVA